MPTYRFCWGKEYEQQITLLIDKKWEELSSLLAQFLKELKEGADFIDGWLVYLYEREIDYTNITTDYRFGLWESISTKGVRKEHK